MRWSEIRPHWRQFRRPFDSCIQTYVEALIAATVRISCSRGRPNRSRVFPRQGERMRTRTLCASLFAAATLFAGKEALAQDWSFHGGDVVKGGDVIGGEFGWPDASFVWHHGLRGPIDIGIKAPIIY